MLVIVLHGQFDVGAQRSGRYTQDRGLFEIFEQLSERVVVGLINDYQAYIVDFYFFFLKAVVQGFHHSHKAHIIILVVEFLHFTIDDFVGHAKPFEHFGGLLAQLDTVGKYHHLFSGLLDKSSCNLRKHNGFSSSCGQLVQDITARRKLVQLLEDFVQVFLLIAVKRFLFD